MNKEEWVIHKIREAFGKNPYPGDAFLQGSFDGCEPEEEVGPFRGLTNWQSIPAEFLDGHGGALNFFSEAGFRFFLPAYLIADVRRQLNTAEPLFTLTYGFLDEAFDETRGGRVFTIRLGKSVFVNPLRYGASTWYDYARFRLSVFTREEAEAVVAYLEYKREAEAGELDRPRIDAALAVYWRERAGTAPAADELRHHLKEREEHFAAITKKD
jgi:hypothetical protein